jgi:hypothetical protein
VQDTWKRFLKRFCCYLTNSQLRTARIEMPKYLVAAKNKQDSLLIHNLKHSEPHDPITIHMHQLATYCVEAPKITVCFDPKLKKCSRL